MVIEFLTFSVSESDRAQWMEVEERTWSRFLERQPGFVRKQLWLERGRPDEVHAMIVWADDESWFSIPADELAAVDAEMGSWWRDCTLRTFDVIRDC
ncbi:MAG: hypothetical protein RL219_2517 [Actinomycetota bacterium]|jgi:hypothetical protein